MYKEFVKQNFYGFFFHFKLSTLKNQVCFPYYFGADFNVCLMFSYVPPPHINKTSGEHVTAGQTLVLTCTITVDWSIQVQQYQYRHVLYIHLYMILFIISRCYCTFAVHYTSISITTK